MNRSRPWLLSLAILLIFALMIGLSFEFPSPVPDKLDFLVLHVVTKAMRYGISPYDVDGIHRMIAELNHVSIDRVFVPAFAYPPWYVVVFFFFGWMPIEAGARLWFFFNLAMIGVSAWILPNGWAWQKKVPLVLGAVLFFPSLGLLTVGQFSTPILLGSALAISGWRNRSSVWMTIGLSLLTFKPHLGILIYASALIALYLRRDDFGKRTFKLAVFSLLFLFALGLIADRLWFINYFHALINFRSIESVNTCEMCVSLSLTLAQWITGSPQMSIAMGIALIALISFGLWIAICHRSILGDAPKIMIVASAFTALISPYMMNYDYVILIAPLIGLIDSTCKRDWAWASVIYLIPWSALFLGRENQDATLLSAVILLLVNILVMKNDDRQVDAPSITA